MLEFLIWFSISYLRFWVLWENNQEILVWAIRDLVNSVDIKNNVNISFITAHHHQSNKQWIPWIYVHFVWCFVGFYDILCYFMLFDVNYCLRSNVHKFYEYLAFRLCLNSLKTIFTPKLFNEFCTISKMYRKFIQTIKFIKFIKFIQKSNIRELLEIERKPELIIYLHNFSFWIQFRPLVSGKRHHNLLLWVSSVMVHVPYFNSFIWAERQLAFSYLFRSFHHFNFST